MLDRFISWLYITRIWGKRCFDTVPECHTCRRWIEHDWLFNGGDDPDEWKQKN